MCINHAVSDPTVVTSGVFKSSVLGLLQFTLFINDMPGHISHGEPILYADDLKLVYHLNSLSIVKDDINSDSIIFFDTLKFSFLIYSLTHVLSQY